MTNKFEITLTAADKATRVIRSVNRSMANMMRPAAAVGASFRAVSREVRLNPVIKGMNRLGSATAGVARSIAKVYSPFAALTGIGSIAGVAALADSWGRVGVNIGNASRRIGISTGRLMQYRGAAIAAGTGAEGMQQAVGSLADTLQDASMGRNNNALGILTKLGIGIHRDRRGVVDVNRAMMDLADAIQRVGNPQTQALIARTFGLESQLPILQRGSKALREYMDQARKAGAADEEAMAVNEKFGRSWNRLKLAIDGAGLSLSKNFLPSLTQATDKVAAAMSSKHVGISDRLRATWSVLNHPLNQEYWQLPGTGPNGYPVGSEDRQSTGRIGGGASRARGIRNNNPLNLRAWSGAGNEGGYAVFPDAASGIRAAVENLQSYRRKYGIDTVRGIINRWAPAKDNGGQANTDAYVADVTRRAGFAPDAHLNTADPKVLAPLLSAMIRHENGANPYTPEQISAGITAALGNAPQQAVQITVHAPPGSRVDAKTAQGLPVPVKVAYSMEAP